MLEDSLDPRPLSDIPGRQSDSSALLAALQRDPAAITRNWHDRRSAWANLAELRHWIDRSPRGPAPDGTPG